MLARMWAKRVLRAIIASLAWAAASTAAAQCLSAPPPENEAADAASGPTRNDRLGRVVAPVMVNGQGPYRFIVDTGANRSVVSEALALRLGLTQSGAAIVHSVHGSAEAPLVAVNSLTYGALALPSEQMPMLQGAMLAGEQGLLGVDGMRGRRLRLDFDSRCIEIIPSRRAPPLGRGWTRIRGELRFGHLVVVRGLIDGMRVNVLIDTGSNVSLANTALQRAMATRTRPVETVEQASRAYHAGEPVVLRTAIVAPRIEIADLQISDVLLFVGDFHVFSIWGLQDEPTMLIGMDVLSVARELAIDYERATVYFRIRSRRAERFTNPTLMSTNP